jgi:hypothetical protein
MNFTLFFNLWVFLLLGFVSLLIAVFSMAAWHTANLLWRMRNRMTFLFMSRVELYKLNEYVSLPPQQFSDQINRYLGNELVKQALLLFDRGEKLAEYIASEYGNDYDARLMKRKLSFFKQRPDLIKKYRRLPYIVSDWELDPSDPPCWDAFRFNYDWKKMEIALNQWIETSGE